MMMHLSNFSLGTTALEPKTVYLSPKEKLHLELWKLRVARVPSNKGEREYDDR